MIFYEGISNITRRKLFKVLKILCYNLERFSMPGSINQGGFEQKKLCDSTLYYFIKSQIHYFQMFYRKNYQLPLFAQCSDCTVKKSFGDVDTHWIC